MSKPNVPSLAIGVVSLSAALLGTGDTPPPPPPMTVTYIGNWPAAADLPYQRFKHAFERLGPEAMSRVRFHHRQVADDDDVLMTRQVAEVMASARSGIIVASTGGTMMAAARWATATTPVVFGTHVDPLSNGVVKSLRASGRPIAGASFADALDEKRLETLRDAFPAVRNVAVLSDRMWPEALQGEGGLFDTLSKRTGMSLTVVFADDVAQLDTLMTSVAASSFDAWYVPFTYIAYVAEPQIVAHITRLARPAVFSTPRAVARGATLSYWQDTSYAYDAIASLCWRIVQGEDPATIPVERPKRFVLEVRGDASDAGLRIDPSVIRRADIVR